MTAIDIWLLVVAALLVVIAGLFSAAEAAFASFSKVRAEEIARGFTPSTTAAAIGLPDGTVAFAADAGAHGVPRDGMRIGALAWLMGHGSGVTVQGAPVPQASGPSASVATTDPSET